MTVFFSVAIYTFLIFYFFSVVWHQIVLHLVSMSAFNILGNENYWCFLCLYRGTPHSLSKHVLNKSHLIRDVTFETLGTCPINFTITFVFPENFNYLHVISVWLVDIIEKTIRTTYRRPTHVTWNKLHLLVGCIGLNSTKSL